LAALFRERVIALFETLNFDLVPIKALSDVGAMNDIAVIRGASTRDSAAVESSEIEQD
jgi:hypothetical protein